MAKLAQGTSVTIATLLVIPDSISLIPNATSPLSWALSVLTVWISALILWFLGFLAILYLVRFLGQGITIDSSGIRLWRLGRHIPWSSISALAVEPQAFFSNFFRISPMAQRLTLFIKKKSDSLYTPQFVPSFLFLPEEFEQLFQSLCKARFDLVPDSHNVLLCQTSELPDLKKMHAILGWQRKILSVVITLSLVIFLGRKAVVHYLYSEGNKAFSQGLYQSAQHDYQLVISLDPAFGVAWHNLAGAEFHLGNLEKARQYWQKALSLKPDLVDARVSLSYIYLQQREFAKAQDLLDHALRFDPNNIGALTNLSDLNMRLGHTRTAIKVAHQVLALDKHNALATCLLAQGRLQMGKYKEALDLLPAPEKSADNQQHEPFCNLVKGEVYLDLGHLDEAAQIFNDVYRTSPGNMDALLDLARVRIAQRQYDSAEAWLRQASTLNPRNPWTWLLWADIGLQKQDTAQARSLLKQAMRQEDQDAKSLAAEAAMALKLKDRDSAIDLARKSLKLEPFTPDALSVLRDANRTGS